MLVLEATEAMTHELDRVIASPEMASKLNAQVEDDSSTANDIAKLIELDPMLTVTSYASQTVFRIVRRPLLPRSRRGLPSLARARCVDEVRWPWRYSSPYSA